MLNGDFYFSFRNYDKGIDDGWGRDEDMKVTSSLFQNAERLDLIWDNIVLSSIDTLSANIERGFNLTISFNQTDVIRIDGRVYLKLDRASIASAWKITNWIDESNF